MNFEQIDMPILQINIDSENEFKHVIKPLSNMERLALIQYLELIKEQLNNDLNFEFGDIE